MQSNDVLLLFQLLQLTSKIQHVWKHRSNSRFFHSSQKLQNSICDPAPISANIQNSIRFRRFGKRVPKRRGSRYNGIFGQGHDETPDSASDLEYTSSSEQSCTTVIYLGRSHPLRKLNTTERTKRFMNSEKKEVDIHLLLKLQIIPKLSRTTTNINFSVDGCLAQ